MGSQKPQDEITVLVTGFAAFREQYPVNPSYEIAKGLPSYLPPLRAKSTASRATILEDIPPVRIVVHPEPIRVSYKAVRALVPSFWPESGGDDHGDGDGDGALLGDVRADYVLHIGMAGPRPMYQIERRGHRTGYKALDVDGEMLEDETSGQRGEDWIWHGLPDEIETDLDLSDILERWHAHSAKHLDLRVSDDAGRYLCDFIYYSSLSTLYKQKRERNVLFWHVPADASEQAVEQGRELGLNLIRAIVESQEAKKRAGGGGRG